MTINFRDKLPNEEDEKDDRGDESDTQRTIKMLGVRIFQLLIRLVSDIYLIVLLCYL